MFGLRKTYGLGTGFYGLGYAIIWTMDYFSRPQDGDPQDAVDMCTEVLEIDEHNYDALCDRADSYSNAGQYDEGEYRTFLIIFGSGSHQHHRGILVLCPLSRDIDVRFCHYHIERPRYMY